MTASIFKRTCVTIAATAAALMFAMPAARAVTTAVNQQNFQLDGDAKAATCGLAFGTTSCDLNTIPTGTTASAVDDWDSLYNCNQSGKTACQTITTQGANLANVIGQLVDEFNSPDPDNLGQGTKDDMNVSFWNWTSASGSAKTNIMQSFAAKYGDSLYIGGNRDINNGDANFGVWLLQNATVKCTAAMVSAGQCATAGTFVGKPDSNGFRSLVPHKIGDVLIVSAFTNGGTVANIQVYKVIQTVGHDSNPNAVAGTCPANAFDGYANKSTGTTGICLQQLVTQTQQGTALCNNGVPGVPDNAACAATNGGVVDALDPRFLSSQSGSIQGKYPALTFFEVGLSLIDLGLGTECFPNYIVEGRQSQSVTSSLNDFTFGQFQSCDAGIVTKASGPVTVGAMITDTATLSGTTGGATPTGTITFKAYNDSMCTNQVNTTSTKTVSGFGDYTSDAYPTTAAGTIYWIASYSGDANFPARTGSCGDANESSVVNKATPSISTTQSSTTASIGDKIWDTATLSNAFGSATGTITFTLYGPADTTCSSALATYAVSVSLNGADSRNTSPTNLGFTVTTAGTYHWKASYNGDSNNAGADDGNASATSGCSAEPVVVAKNSPAVQTTPKVQLIMTDVATLSGFAGTPTGTFNFFLYQNDSTCANSSNVVYSITNVAYNGTTTGATTTSGTLPSATMYYTNNTAFKWVVTYSGDANNNFASSGCGEPVSVSFQ